MGDLPCTHTRGTQVRCPALRASPHACWGTLACCARPAAPQAKQSLPSSSSLGTTWCFRGLRTRRPTSGCRRSRWPASPQQAPVTLQTPPVPGPPAPPAPGTRPAALQALRSPGLPPAPFHGLSLNNAWFADLSILLSPFSPEVHSAFVHAHPCRTPPALRVPRGEASSLGPGGACTQSQAAFAQHATERIPCPLR